MSETRSDDPLIEKFNQGAVFAYPTEAVFGLGCDPDNEQAVMKLLSLKQRPVEKGLILIAKTYSQLLPYVDDQNIAMDMRTEIFSSWPGAVTWLLPKSRTAPDWITGGSDLIAVRVTDHTVVQSLCEKVNKPLVSTSANLSGQEPATTVQQVTEQFADSVVIIEGKVGGNEKPSVIRNGFDGTVIRGG